MGNAVQHKFGRAVRIGGLCLGLSACATGWGSRPDLVGPTPPYGPIVWREFSTHEDPIRTLAMDGDDLWMGTMKGVIRFNAAKGKYEIFTPDNTRGGFISRAVYIISIDPRGNKWIGTYGGGLSRFDGKTWKRFSKLDGLGDDWIYDIVYDAGGRMWVATWDGVSVFDGERFKTYTVADGLADKWVYSIALDRRGVFWFGTEAGISRFDGEHWTTFSHKDGVGAEVGGEAGAGNVPAPFSSTPRNPSEGEGEYGSFDLEHHMAGGKQNVKPNPDFIIASAVDGEDRKWFGTWGAGVARYDGSAWVNFTVKEGLGGNYIFALAVDPEGRIWAGTNGGASWFDGNRWHTLDHTHGLQDDNVLSLLFDRQGRRWFGTTKGLSVFRGGLPETDPPRPSSRLPQDPAYANQR